MEVEVHTHIVILTTMMVEVIFIHMTVQREVVAVQLIKDRVTLLLDRVALEDPNRTVILITIQVEVIWI